VSEKFPLLGFPNERNTGLGDNVIYMCLPLSNARVCVWKFENEDYGVNIYRHPQMDEDLLTSVHDRFDPNQSPIRARDVFEAQLAIFHLIQTHLPHEVTDHAA